MSGAKEDDQSVSNGMSTAAEVAGGYIQSVWCCDVR